MTVNAGSYHNGGFVADASGTGWNRYGGAQVAKAVQSVSLNQVGFASLEEFMAPPGSVRATMEGAPGMEVRLMIYKTLQGMLHPDGTVTFPSNDRPDHPVRVLVTFLEDGENASLTEPGDYLARLTDYEDRLARGEIQWQ